MTEDSNQRKFSYIGFDQYQPQNILLASVIKNEDTFVVVDTPKDTANGKSEKSSGAQLVPTQVKQKYESSAVIYEAPALYNTAKTSKSGSSKATTSVTLEKPHEPPQVSLLQVCFISQLI